MLTDEEFHAWVRRNQIDPSTEAVLSRIRSSPRAWAGLECEWTVSIRENGPLHSIREPACGTLGHLEVSPG